MFAFSQQMQQQAVAGSEMFYHSGLLLPEIQLHISGMLGSLFFQKSNKYKKINEI